MRDFSEQYNTDFRGMIMNKKLVSLAISVLLLGQSANILCGPISFFSGIGKILKPRWSSIDGRTEYVSVDRKDYMIACDSENIPVTDIWFELKKSEVKQKTKEYLRLSKISPDNVGRAVEEAKKEIINDIYRINNDIDNFETLQKDDIGRRFLPIEIQKKYQVIMETDKTKSFDEVQKIKWFPVVCPDGTVKLVYYAPKQYEKTVSSDQVRIELSDAELKTECLKPLHRIMLGNKVMKIWSVSVYSGVAVAVGAVAYKLHKKFIQPRMEKLTKTLDLDEDELLERGIVVANTSSDASVENVPAQDSVDQLGEDLE